MDDNSDCPHPLAKDDAAVLIGILANLAGLLAVRRIDGQEYETLRSRAEQDGFIPRNGGHYELRQALDDLIQRIRYVLGEYESPPPSVPVDPSPTWRRGKSADGKELRIDP